MKKIRANMDRYFDRLDERWRALPIRTQHRYTLCIFLGYLILTIGVILKVWYNTGKPNYGLVIEHIENPTIKKNEPTKSLQDSLSIILKNKMHERK